MNSEEFTSKIERDVNSVVRETGCRLPFNRRSCCSFCNTSNYILQCFVIAQQRDGTYNSYITSKINLKTRGVIGFKIKAVDFWCSPFICKLCCENLSQWVEDENSKYLNFLLESLSVCKNIVENVIVPKMAKKYVYKLNSESCYRMH